MPDKTLKVCYTCHKEKEISQFNKNIKRKDGLQSICKECSKERSKKFYADNKEKHKQTATDRKNKVIKVNKQLIYDYQKLRGCIDCKENDPVCLDFDHVSGEKIETISRMIHNGHSTASLLDEISKCVIRCSNCHRKKTAKDFDWYKDINKGP
jgi:hypothetical protein